MQTIPVFWCIAFTVLALTPILVFTEYVNPFPSSSNVNSVIIKEEKNCTSPAIDDFPPDIFTQEERQQGYVAIHFIASIYMFYCLALVCQDYFVPCIECCCEELHIPGDVAGATLMAIATSSPEFFTNLVGTFITKGDLGVGTIVGSGVFNILGVAACVGLASKTALPLEWYSFTRDCIFYSISAILLILFLGKRHIFWYEALILVVVYAVYIFVMYINSSLKQRVECIITRYFGTVDTNSDVDVSNAIINASSSQATASIVSTEKTPLLEPKVEKDMGSQSNSSWLRVSDGDELLQRQQHATHWTSSRLPYEMTIMEGFHKTISLPPRLAFALTIPNCSKEVFRKWYPVAFVMCIFWIAVLSYFVSWTITIIGHTLSIPDSVMGLTFIAAGASIPEVVSSIIVARQGLAAMSMGNSIGSNTFDILICLGIPWLIRGCIIAEEPVNYIKINSGGLEYSVVALLISLLLLYGILACNRFYLDKKVGFVALLLYLAFTVIACMFELNVFFTVNLPTCDTNS